ncbi:MAG: hypothetical protein V1837_07975 [Candidatus Woesearchaeota archaeon]
MVTAPIVEKRTIKSFNKLKSDIQKVSVWISWNRREHELLKERIAALEVQLELSKFKYIASTTSKKVHNPNCVHVKKISGENRQYFEILTDARKLGYSFCECTA